MNAVMDRVVKIFLAIFGASIQNFTNNSPTAVTVTVIGHDGTWFVAPGQTVQLPDGHIVIGGSSGEGGGGPGEEQ